MDVSLYQAAAAMNATAQWQELIAENLTSSQISGGRKREIEFSDVQAGADANTSGNSSYSIPMASTVTNFEPGELHVSSSPMDFALEGKGFFTVQLPDGETAYTRGGGFELNSKHQLVTNQGYLVMGSAGPLQFNPQSSAPITVSASGDVSQGETRAGKFKVVEFNNPNLLTMLGADEFRSDNPAAVPQAAVATQVRQGFLEAANTSPTTEMTGMVTAMRAFESNQKVMQMESDRMSRTITELGGTS